MYCENCDKNCEECGLPQELKSYLACKTNNLLKMISITGLRHQYFLKHHLIIFTSMFLFSNLVFIITDLETACEVLRKT